MNKTWLVFIFSVDDNGGMKISQGMKFVIAVAATELVGLLGSIFTSPAIPGWYAGLIKPAIAPPNWIFAPVWTILFFLMGYAVFLVWRRGLSQRGVPYALIVFCVQLACNLAWSYLFFGLQSPGAAFAEILVLWIAIFWTLAAFSKISRKAAYLLVPYLAWVSFAAYLNFLIWRLN